MAVMEFTTSGNDVRKVTDREKIFTSEKQTFQPFETVNLVVVHDVTDAVAVSGSTPHSMGFVPAFIGKYRTDTGIGWSGWSNLPITAGLGALDSWSVYITSTTVVGEVFTIPFVYLAVEWELMLMPIDISVT